MRSVAIFLAVGSMVLAARCVYALHGSYPETEVKLVLQSATPVHHTVQVVSAGTSEFGFSPTGQVSFLVPSIPGGCSEYLFGFITIKDRSPGNRKVVYILRDGRVVRQLSLEQIAELPRDDAGYSIVRLRR